MVLKELQTGRASEQVRDHGVMFCFGFGIMNRGPCAGDGNENKI